MELERRIEKDSNFRQEIVGTVICHFIDILEAVINNLKENLRKYHAQNSLVKSINRGWV